MDETTQILADEDMTTSTPNTTIVAETPPGPKDADGTDTQDADGTDGDTADGTDGDSSDADGADGGDTDGTDAQA